MVGWVFLRSLAKSSEKNGTFCCTESNHAALICFSITSLSMLHCAQPHLRRPSLEWGQNAPSTVSKPAAVVWCDHSAGNLSAQLSFVYVFICICVAFNGISGLKTCLSCVELLLVKTFLDFVAS